MCAVVEAAASPTTHRHNTPKTIYSSQGFSASGAFLCIYVCVISISLLPYRSVLFYSYFFRCVESHRIGTKALLRQPSAETTAIKIIIFKSTLSNKS